MTAAPAPGAAAVTHRRRVAWSDTDASGAWMFTAVLTYAEEAEAELLRAAGVLTDIYGRLPRVYAEAQFAGPAYFDDEIDVRLTLRRLGRSSLHYAFHLYREGELVAHGKLGAALVSDGAPAPLPEPVRAALRPYLEERDGQAP